MGSLRRTACATASLTRSTIILVAGATYLLSLGALRVRGLKGSAAARANSAG